MNYDFLENCKFINDIANFKVGYLYYMVDKDSCVIFEVNKSTAYKIYVHMIPQSVIGNLNTGYTTVDDDEISDLPVDHENFQEARFWAFYEIGHKDFFPEHLI